MYRRVSWERHTKKLPGRFVSQSCSLYQTAAVHSAYAHSHTQTAQATVKWYSCTCERTVARTRSLYQQRKPAFRNAQREREWHICYCKFLISFSLSASIWQLIVLDVNACCRGSQWNRPLLPAKSVGAESRFLFFSFFSNSHWPADHRAE